MKQKLWSITFDCNHIVVDNRWCMEDADKDFFLDTMIPNEYITVIRDYGTPDNPYNKDEEMYRDRDTQWLMMSDEEQSDLVEEFFESFRIEFEDYK